LYAEGAQADWNNSITLEDLAVFGWKPSEEG
jgi:hypothetical protein